MQKRIVTPNESGQRLDKLLAKYLKAAPKSFIYKMLRKKNITLNGKKADGSEKTCTGDEITLWLADETIEKFAGNVTFKRTKTHPDIVYEDKNIIIMNKPAGILSQKASEDDVSVNEQMITYLLDTEQLSDKDLGVFKPSVTNRLDRNTSGLIAAGKSMAGLQELSELFRERKIHKFYYCIVTGVMEKPMRIEGYLTKDAAANKVTVTNEKSDASDFIQTAYTPLGNNKKCTLLRVELITGRTHQIRAHLAAEGYPIIGDYKYGDEKVNDYYKAKYHLKHQLLHAGILAVPEISGELGYLSGKIFKAQLPENFKHILAGEKILNPEDEKILNPEGTKLLSTEEMEG